MIPMKDFEIYGGGQILSAAFDKTEDLPDAAVYRLTLSFSEETVPAPVTVRWKEPNNGAFSVFAPNHYYDRRADGTLKTADPRYADPSGIRQ